MNKVKLKRRSEVARIIARRGKCKGVPAEKIKQCPECGKSFFQITTLKKYCSHKCADRKIPHRPETTRRSSTDQYARLLKEKHGVEYIPTKVAGLHHRVWVPVKKGEG